MPEYHPDAKASFMSRAEVLFARVVKEQAPDAPPPESRFTPDLRISGSFGPGDMIGELRRRQLDADGQEIARYIANRDRQISFEGEAYAELVGLGRGMHRVGFMHDSVTLDRLLDWLVDWMFAKPDATGLPDVVDYVLQRRAAAVTSVRILVPLCEPFLETPCDLGKTHLRPITRAEVDEWFRLPDNVKPEHRVMAEGLMETRRKNLQARTAVVVDVEAERSRAVEIAWDRADLVASALRILSKGMFFPRARSNCVPLGMAVFEKRQLIEMRGDVGNWSEELIDPESVGRWTIDRRMWEQDLPYFSALAALLDAPDPSAFQKVVLRSVLLYSRIGLSREIADKLVLLFASVESLLLRSDSEPIQSAVSERMAFVTGRTPKDRAEIARIVKKVYGMRSRFVHHGRDPEDPRDIQLIKQLLFHTWTFFFEVVRLAPKYRAKEEFLDVLEMRKWK